jgi:hypothetical protein
VYLSGGVGGHGFQNVRLPISDQSGTCFKLAVNITSA